MSQQETKPSLDEDLIYEACFKDKKYDQVLKKTWTFEIFKSGAEWGYQEAQAKISELEKEQVQHIDIIHEMYEKKLKESKAREAKLVEALKQIDSMKKKPHMWMLGHATNIAEKVLAELGIEVKS